MTALVAIVVLALYAALLGAVAAHQLLPDLPADGTRELGRGGHPTELAEWRAA